MKKNKNRAWLSISILMALLSANALAEANERADYRLAPGDTVRVIVYGHEDLSGEFEVDGAGRISLPLIRDVDAEGRSLQELEEIITAKLSPDYLKEPRVSTEVLNYRPFYIIGEVSEPGSYPYVNGMTIINAVAVAGGFTYRARKSRIRIVRESDAGTVELEASNDTAVMPGDVIEVPERFF
ncbi:MAG: polysaccharide export protein [Gammaproteobacteria bacterium]|nr:polysaccharide export protein [Gammaproteobacteria bacterium]